MFNNDLPIELVDPNIAIFFFIILNNNIYNILATLAVMSINIDITKLDKKVFFK